MNKKLLHSFILVSVFGFSSIAKSEVTISPIMGVTNWGDDTFTINGSTIVLDTQNVLTRGIEVGHMFDSGLHLGGQAKYQEADVISNSNGSNTGYVDMAQANVTVSYYIPTGEYVKPFFGFGMGHTRVGFNGGTNATLEGETYVGKVGLEIKMVERVHWVFSAQSSYFKAKDDDNRMETNLNEFYIGVSMRAGARSL